MGINKNNLWKWVLMFILSLALLYFAFKGVKWEDFVEGLRSCNYWLIGGSMAVGIAAFYLRALRWRLLMKPINPNITRKEAYHGVTIGYLTNFALPRAGEFARCGIIASSGKASFESVLGSVVLERLADVIALGLILLTLLLTMWDKIGVFIYDQMWAPVSEALSSSIWTLLLSVSVIISILIAAYVFRAQLRKSKIISLVLDKVVGLKNGVVAGVKMKEKWLFLFQTILIWICYWLMSYTTIKAFPQVSSLNGIDALMLTVIGGLGWAVPVQGGIGAYHFIVSLAIASIYGISQSTGVILATISHESQAFTMLICGFISLISINISRRRSS